jgi:hypothetical protein
VALAALYGTWSENIAYTGSIPHVFGSFLADLKVNPASRSISVDLAWFLLAAAVFMVREARRIGQRFVWVYIALSFLIAVSVMFPLYLMGREIRMASPPPAPKPSQALVAADILGLTAITALTLYLALWLH